MLWNWGWSFLSTFSIFSITVGNLLLQIMVKFVYQEKLRFIFVWFCNHIFNWKIFPITSASFSSTKSQYVTFLIYWLSLASTNIEFFFLLTVWHKNHFTLNLRFHIWVPLVNMSVKMSWRLPALCKVKSDQQRHIFVVFFNNEKKNNIILGWNGAALRLLM